MNEQERAKRLSAELERLSQVESDGPPSDGDYDGLLEVVQQLEQADFSGDSTLRETLRKQLLDWQPGQAGGKTVKRKSNIGRTLAVAAAVLVMLTIATLTIPPLRAFAQELLRQIGFINYTDEETPFQRYFQGTPFPTYVPPPADQRTPRSRPAPGTPPYMPEYVPDGYQLDARGSNISVAMYMKTEAGTDEYQTDVNYWLQIQQESSDNRVSSFPIGDTEVIDVTVRGQHGIWIEQAPIGAQTDSKGREKPMNVNMLTWEEAGITFIMHNLVQSVDDDDHPLLTLDEMIRVAESLQKS